MAIYFAGHLVILNCLELVHNSPVEREKKCNLKLDNGINLVTFLDSKIAIFIMVDRQERLLMRQRGAG